MEKQFTFRKLLYSNLGIIDYQKAWNLQHKIFNNRLSNEIEDTLLLLEHPNTYTLGKSSNKANLLFSDLEMQQKNIVVYNIDRGGDITYHGPGQIVGYPIINLSLWQKDIHKYLRTLEEVIIQTLLEFGVNGERNKEHTGVWVGNNKICAIGIKVTRWITMHGFALNINTNMDFFNGIIPCGIKNKGVTSLKNELNKQIEIELVKKSLLQKFYEIFDYNELEIQNGNF
jgi:lipoyl(octanoyl) transferase